MILHRKGKVKTTCRGWKHIRDQHQMAIKEAKASRAVYLSENIQRVEVDLEMEDGTRLVLTMSSHLAGKLILQMSAAYTAINPPLRTGSGASNWKGMD